MFTGIIETLGEVTEVILEGSNQHLTIKSPISKELKIDQSVSHNGVCLTVIAVNDDTHTVTAIKETLNKTTIGILKVGSKVNLERCTMVGSRLDGHIVQGHIDQKGICISKKDENGSWLYSFKYDSSLQNITVEKGSICIDGISLTVFDSEIDQFTVAIIPYTFENTNFQYIGEGTEVNLEFDIIGKYVSKLLLSREKA